MGQEKQAERSSEDGGKWATGVGELLGVEKSWIKQVGNKAAVFLRFSEADIRPSAQPRRQSKRTPGWAGPALRCGFEPLLFWERGRSRSRPGLRSREAA